VRELQSSQGWEKASEFYRAEYPYLYRYALFLCPDQYTAEELCQETFLRWFRLEAPETVEYPRAWLKKVLSRLTINHFERQKRRSTVEVPGDAEKIRTVVDWKRDIERLEIEDVLSRLTVRDQMLLKMKMAGLSYAEMAEVLGVAPGSVGTLLARSLRRFKLEYEDEEGRQGGELHRRRKIITLFG